MKIFKLGIHEVDDLMAQREEARKRKDFVSADRIKQQLTETGITILDSATKSDWYRSNGVVSEEYKKFSAVPHTSRSSINLTWEIWLSWLPEEREEYAVLIKDMMEMSAICQ